MYRSQFIQYPFLISEVHAVSAVLLTSGRRLSRPDSQIVFIFVVIFGHPLCFESLRANKGDFTAAFEVVTGGSDTVVLLDPVLVLEGLLEQTFVVPLEVESQVLLILQFFQNFVLVVEILSVSHE